MELEKEKKDKLASARKKLNEYKLNRGTGKNAAVTNASSKPADVPSFYQSVNAPATTFNLFNPAAVDNNNQATNPSLYFNQTPPPALPPTSSALVFPVAGGAGDIYKPDTTAEQNQYTFLNNNQSQPLFTPQQIGTFGSAENNLSPEVISPISVSPPLVPVAAEQILAPSWQQAPPTDILQSEFIYSAPSSSLFSDVVPLSQELSAYSDKHVPVHQSPFSEPNNNANENILAHDANLLQMNQNELFPSAPPLDMVLQNLAGGDALIASADESLEQSKEVEIKEEKLEFVHPVVTPEDLQEHSLHGEARKDSSDQHTSPLFASSLFSFQNGQSNTNDVYDQVFNISSGNQPLITPTIAPEASRNEEDSPPKNALMQQASTVAVAETLAAPDNIIPLPVEPLSENTIEAPVTSSIVGTSPFPDVGLLDESSKSPLDIFENPLNVAPENLNGIGSNVLSVDLLSDVASNSNDSNAQWAETVRRNSVETVPTTQNVHYSEEVVSQMKSVQDALELQIEELRRENEYLLGRQTELTTKIEESETSAHNFKLERDRIKEEAIGTSQALRARINSLCEENQRIVKNSTDVGVDLRAVLEEKAKQLEEMQNAVIVVSQSKMEFAAKLDHELERVKELEGVILEKNAEMSSLRNENTTLQEKLKSEQQKDAVIHQLKDQARHYQFQAETLQKETISLRRRVNELQVSPVGTQAEATSSENHSHDADPEHHLHHHHNDEQYQHQVSLDRQQSSADSDLTSSHNHDHDATTNSEVKDSGTVIPAVHNTDHVHSESCDHSHHHDDHHHNHSHHHSHHHDHDHNDHNHDHSHDHDHHNEHSDVANGEEGSLGVVARRGPSDEMTELKKTLHRLHWENSNFRNEIDILAGDAKQKRTYEDKCVELEEENALLKEEIERLEHVIIQLQGENDTIGDYITLYQTQKLALKECAKEKDAQLEQLAREREMLLQRLSELTTLVNELKDSKSEVSSQCADHEHIHNLESSLPTVPGNNKRQIEGKIRDLLSEIGSSSLIENFHPCAVCSGRLMTV